MKKTALTILGLLMVMFAISQGENTQGTIIFEEVDKIDIQIDNMTPEMAAMIPKENRNSTVLYFDENVSRYENYEAEGDASIIDESHGGVQIMISQPENIIYRDLSNNKVTEQTEFMTRVFLIESENEKDEWKITGKQKKILDFPCQEAISGEGDNTFTVWFTPAIPVSTGPGKFANLPGMVLEMEADSGNRIIIAKNITLAPVDSDKLKKPRKGKKVSDDEFKAIVAEKTKEMGGEGNVEGTKTMIMTISQ